MCSSKKSSYVLRGLIRKWGLQEPTEALYYAYASAFKKSFTCKYRNRYVLSDICSNTNSKALLANTKDDTYDERLTLEAFCRLLRTLAVYFLEELCPLTLIASRKIYKMAKIEHLRRRRIITRHIRKAIPKN